MKDKNKVTIFIAIILIFVILISIILLFINGGKDNSKDNPKPTPSNNSSSSNSNSNSDVNIKEPDIEVTDEKTLAVKMATLASIDRDVTFDVVNSELVGNNIYHVTLKNKDNQQDVKMEVNMNTMEAYQVFTGTNGKLD